MTKENKELSDKELAAKYEAGDLDLSRFIKESMKGYKPIKRIVSDRANKRSG